MSNAERPAPTKKVRSERSLARSHRASTRPARREACSAANEPPRRRIGQYVEHFPGAVAVLELAPEGRGQDLAVRLQEGAAQLAAETEERQELLGEDVVFTHVEPRLA